MANELFDIITEHIPEHLLVEYLKVKCQEYLSSPTRDIEDLAPICLMVCKKIAAKKLGGFEKLKENYKKHEAYMDIMKHFKNEQ